MSASHVLMQLTLSPLCFAVVCPVPSFISVLNACALQAGQRIWHNILTGVAEEHPSCLCLFMLLSYADLKKFTYWSWCAHPCSIHTLASKLLASCNSKQWQHAEHDAHALPRSAKLCRRCHQGSTNIPSCVVDSVQVCLSSPQAP